MNRILISLLGWIMVSGLLACSDKTPKLIPRPEQKKKVEDDYGDVKLAFNPKVDILFVVDNSGSMDIHQDELAQNIALFTEGIDRTKFLDYHIGVITTDMFDRRQQGRLVYQRGSPPYIERSTPLGLNWLEENLRVGSSGSGEETVFAPVVAGLSEPLLSGHNSGFYREDAHLAIMMLTNAMDQSDYTASSMYNFLVGLKRGLSEKVSVYGVYNIPGDQSCPPPFSEDSDPRFKIRDLIKLTKGISLSICSEDYGRNLAEVGEDLLGRVGLFIPLKTLPVLDTIVVKFGDEVLPQDARKGWSYDPQRVGLRLGEEIELKGTNTKARLTVTYIPAKLEEK